MSPEEPVEPRKFPSGRPTVGLVLGGGAVRGAAHLGVLDVLEDHGFEPDLVTACSIGSVVAALHLAGCSPEALFDLFEHVSWRSLVSLSIPPRESLMSISGLEDYLRPHLEERSFGDLPAPLALVACDLQTGERVVLDQGELMPAVLASCALPGLFPPVSRGENLLVDGGVVDVLPAELARRRGAEYVVAVDLLPPLLPMPERPNFLESWERALYLLMRGNGPDDDELDCRIQPDIADFSFTDFDQVLELFRRGRQAARDALPLLRDDLALS